MNLFDPTSTSNSALVWTAWLSTWIVTVIGVAPLEFQVNSRAMTTLLVAVPFVCDTASVQVATMVWMSLMATEGLTSVPRASGMLMLLTENSPPALVPSKLKTWPLTSLK